jgi:hypothetical protein
MYLVIDDVTASQGGRVGTTECGVNPQPTCYARGFFFADIICRLVGVGG